jgi:hypothetical protein
MIDDDAVRHYVTTVAMSDLDFVQTHIYQIGRLIRDNRLPLDGQDPLYLEREVFPLFRFKNNSFSRMERKLSPNYYNEVFALYHRWDKIGRRQEDKEYKEANELEKQWQECWKLEKEAHDALS